MPRKLRLGGGIFAAALVSLTAATGSAQEGSGGIPSGAAGAKVVPADDAPPPPKPAGPIPPKLKTKVDPTNFFHLNPNIKPKAQPV